MNTLCTDIANLLLERGESVATAESCTGGLVAKLLTDIAGSSGWFERGVVTYSNLAKQDLLDVPTEILDSEGAVSEAAAQCMVEGLLMSSPADWGIAITGIAGPTGGTKAKPVGTVWIAWARRERFASTARSDAERPARDGRAGGSDPEQSCAKDGENKFSVLVVRRHLFKGDRAQVREQTAQAVLEELLKQLRHG